MAAKDLTSGSIPLLTVQLALPVLGSFVLQSAYQLVDLYFVGSLGPTPIAALSISFNLFFITLALGMTVGVGGLALISQAYGRGARAEVPVLFQQAAWIALALGALLWAGVALGARPFLALFSADPQVVADGVPFLRIMAPALALLMMGMATSMCFRAVGDFILPTAMMAMGVLTNMVLDPLLIFGLGPFPRLGLQGAAWATLAAQLPPLAVTAWLVLRPGAVLGLRRPFRLRWGAIWTMLRIGIPSGLQFVFFAGTLMVTFRYVRPYGADATAAVGVGFRILETGVFPMVAIGSAVSSLAGQNFGARRLDRVRATVLWGMSLGAAVALAEFAVLVWEPRFWLGLFTEAPVVVDIGAQYLSVVALVLVLVGPIIPAEFLGMGLGRTLLPLLAQVARMAALLGCLALLVDAWGYGLAGVFWSRALSVLPESVGLLGVLAYWWLTVLRDPRPLPAATPATATADAR